MKKIQEEIDVFPSNDETKDLNWKTFLTNFDAENNEYTEDVPHPKEEDRTLLQDIELRMHNYFERREKALN
jgi:hypothetical protein